MIFFYFRNQSLCLFITHLLIGNVSHVNDIAHFCEVRLIHGLVCLKSSDMRDRSYHCSSCVISK